MWVPGMKMSEFDHLREQDCWQLSMKFWSSLKVSQIYGIMMTEVSIIHFDILHVHGSL